MGMDPRELYAKTGIPVLTLGYGDLGAKSEIFFSSLRTLGTIIGREERAEKLIRFFEETEEDLKGRMSLIPQKEKPEYSDKSGVEEM